MKIAFLIGNGFDLNLGLKTSYSDFIEAYIKETEYCKNDNDSIKKFKAHIAGDKEHKTWGDAELALGGYTENFNDGELEFFLEHYADFCNNLAKYLKSEESRLGLTTLYPSECLKAFSSFFGKAISNIPPQQKNRLLDLIKENIISVDFINFNYTSTLDDLILNDFNGYELAKYSEDNLIHTVSLNGIVNVHGLTSQNLVLGVNDKWQIKNPQLFASKDYDNSELIIKPRINEVNGHEYSERAKSMIDRANVVYIYGMSLGATDAYWWRYIMQWLNKTASNYLIINKFGLNMTQPVSPIRMREISKIKEEIMKYAEDNEDKRIYFNHGEEAPSFDLRQQIEVQGVNIFEDLKELITKIN